MQHTYTKIYNLGEKAYLQIFTNPKRSWCRHKQADMYIYVHTVFTYSGRLSGGHVGLGSVQ
jgi:hypothetical protein